MPILSDGTVPEGIEAQTRAALANLRRIIELSGFANGTILNARVYLTKFDAHYERMNSVYAQQFQSGELPARTCVGVTALARGCDIEIDAVVSPSLKLSSCWPRAHALSSAAIRSSP